MKTWLGILLTVGMLLVGCASGDYARRPAYGESPSTYRETGMWHQNPETDAGQANRIWSEESGR
jgi:hypothetical protein